MSTLWHSISQFDRSKILRWIALRNSLAVALPLAIGILASKPAAGLIAAIGALNVAYSDGTDPYFYRARRMLAASILVAWAVFVGGFTAGHLEFSLVLMAACAFAAGLMVAASQTGSDIGILTLVTLIVFSAHPMSLVESAQSGALALAGGLLQSLFALALWPVRKHAPERRVLAAFYAELARAASSPAAATEAPPGSHESTQAQHELALLGSNPSVEAERYLGLLSQAERIRLALLALARLRIRMARQPGGDAWLPALERCLDLSSRLLATVAQSLLAGQPGSPHAEYLAEMAEGAEAFRQAVNTAPSGDLRALLREACLQLEALAGQVRSAADLASHVSTRGAAAFARREAEQPWSLRLTGTVALLRANLTLASSAFRHALRLAICVAVGEAVSHAVGWQRAYWMPMTIAIVLRPDFTGTFSRGVLRLLGTFTGLALATAMFHVIQPAIGVQVAIIFLLTFLL